MTQIGSFSGLASGIQWRDMISQIMQLETQRKLIPISRQIDLRQNRQDAWTDFKGVLSTLSSASQGLKDNTAFGAFGVSAGKGTGDVALFSASASTSAAPGNYSVEVRALAKHGKVRTSGSFSSTTDALSKSGTFFVNGKAVAVESGDSLASLRDKINAANSGSSASRVTASIVTVSDTEHYLSLTAESTGTRGIELVDSGDGSSTNGVLQQLGILTGAQAANTDPSDATRHQTQRFSSSSTAVATMLGLTSPPATATIVIDGEQVSVDLLNDSLQDVLDKVDAAIALAGKTTVSELVTETVDGKTTYRLETGTVAADPGAGDDSQRIVELLGFVKGVRANEIQAGANAEVTVDGLAITRRSNTISDALAGVTLNLLAVELGNPVDLTITRDVDAIVDNVQGFVDAFNGMMAFYEKQSRPGAALYADASLRASVSSFRNILLSDVPGISTSSTDFTRTTIAGVSFTKEGKLEIDSEVLSAALTSNFSEVKALFGTQGSATNSNVSFVSGGDATTPGTYAVNITQLATVASHTGTVWSTTYDGSGPDQMTVFDAYTGKSAVISLINGDDIDSVLANLNDEFDAKGMTLSASKTAGDELVITGGKYGSASSFTVSYELEGANWAGTAPTGVAANTYTGLDVAGTIGGEAATGSGQILSADSATTADGLAVQYTGSTLGAQGTASYVRGVAGELQTILDGHTRTGDGLIEQHIATIESSLLTLEDRELNMQARLDRYEEQLIQQFVAMEAALSKFQSQGLWLDGQISALQSLNASQ